MGKLAEILSHPEEVWPLLLMYRAAKQAKAATRGSPDWDFCYGMLNAVSRSFAIVIQQLPAQLRDAVCVFYLVLRALDTIEDDMAIAAKVKVPELIKFHTHLHDKNWKYPCGEKDYRRLMESYPLVTRAFLQLESAHREVITDIARQMGAGMAEFIGRDVKTVADYDMYCHYVAGLIGLGLVKLFKASKLEHGDLNDHLANSMGLFLQKTNIIRDYLEDINELPAPRMFWPHEVWGQFAQRLEDFKDPANSDKAVACLNHLVANALGHAQDSLAFLSRLEDPQIFRFCAIPQVMAFGTLAACFNNPDVFTGVVKMRRGAVAKYMVSISSMQDVYLAFAHFACDIQNKCLDKQLQNQKLVQNIQSIVHEVVVECAHKLNTSEKDLERSGGQLSGAAAPFALSVHSLVLLGVLIAVSLAMYSGLASYWQTSR